MQDSTYEKYITKLKGKIKVVLFFQLDKKLKIIIINKSDCSTWRPCIQKNLRLLYYYNKHFKEIIINLYLS